MYVYASVRRVKVKGARGGQRLDAQLVFLIASKPANLLQLI